MGLLVSWVPKLFMELDIKSMTYYFNFYFIFSEKVGLAFKTEDGDS